MSSYPKRVVRNGRWEFHTRTHFFRFCFRLRFRTGDEHSSLIPTRRGRPVLIAFLLIAATAWAAEAEPAPGSPLTLESAVSLAVKDNPDLAEMHARSEAFAAIPSQVGTLPDPVLSRKKGLNSAQSCTGFDAHKKYPAYAHLFYGVWPHFLDPN